MSPFLFRSTLSNLSSLIRDFFLITIITAFIGPADCYSQDFGTEGNKKPKIEGQRPLSTNEEQPITLSLLDLEVEDDDDLYPFGFTLEVFPGDHYTISDETIYPEKNFSGTLTVPVRVNDGKDNSQKYDLKITVNNVNDIPVITGQQTLGTTAGVPVTIQLSHLTVNDPDDNYPGDFTLRILPGNNYSFSGNQVTPSSSFEGALSVFLRVNDGSAESETFAFKLNVAKGNHKPVITNQTPVVINEDEIFTITFANLTVVDPGDSYPNGYTLKVSSGQNYSLNNNTVIPNMNFNGNIFAPVTVHDGEKTSDPFNFLITVRTVNDAPVLTLNDSSSVQANGNVPVFLLTEIAIADADDDSLTFAETGIEPGQYIPGADVLLFANTASIKGVFDSQSGILALIGKASIAEYITALKSVQYRGSGPSTRNVAHAYFIVSDGQSNSNRVTKKIRFAGGTPGSFDIPAAFTPNGDLVNDTWNIRSVDQQDFSDAVIRVYTKSGVLVFEGTGLAAEWDGRFNGQLLPADVYFYTVDLKLADKDSNIRGIITILR